MKHNIMDNNSLLERCLKLFNQQLFFNLNLIGICRDEVCLFC